MSFEIMMFCKMSCIVTEKHLPKFTFKFTFADTNAAERNNKKSVFLYNTMIKRQTATIYKS